MSGTDVYHAPASQGTSSTGSGTITGDTRALRILATTDLHGKMLAWNYPADEENCADSMPQLATAIASLRDERTLLIDVGDTIQDNMAEVFLKDEVHPMIASLNHLRYDAGIVTELHVEPGVPHAYEYLGWTPQTNRFFELRDQATARMLGNANVSKPEYGGILKHLLNL